MLLVYYIVAENCRERMLRTIQFQRKVLPEWDQLNKLFILEPDAEQIPADNALFVRIPLFRNGLFLFSMAKNAGIQHAVSNGYSWLLDADADTAILNMPTEFPWTGYACVRCHFAKQEETENQVLEKHGAGTLDLQGSSRFLTSREVFSKYRYHEEFAGYDGEDIDYHQTVLAGNNVHQSKTDMIGVHFWHDTSYRPVLNDTLRDERLSKRGF